MNGLTVQECRERNIGLLEQRSQLFNQKMTKDPKPTGFAHVSIANFIYSHKTLMNYKKTLEIEDAEAVQSPPN